MIKIIIFDYDGVIVDSFSKVHEIYQLMCKKLGKYCPEDLEDFRKTYGHSSSECYSQLGFTEEDIIKGNLIFKEEVLKKSPKPFEGIIEVIKELSSKYKLAVISSNYKAEIEQKLEKFGVLNLFDFIMTRKDHVGRFQKTESIKQIIHNLKITPDEVLLIGDRNCDFREGVEAKLKNILLVEYGWGYNSEEIPEHKQKVLIEKPKDILKAINEF